MSAYISGIEFILPGANLSLRLLDKDIQAVVVIKARSQIRATKNEVLTKLCRVFAQGLHDQCTQFVR